MRPIRSLQAGILLIWLAGPAHALTLAPVQQLADGLSDDVLVADMNGDGHPDVLIARGDADDELWLNDGSG
ncbi:MAG TPA: hypothetical protein VKA48_08960, partial [Gammaproteobacteria bacterium]|nr:hypothetical protein [Gammaproteobacteria bacterium]